MKPHLGADRHIHIGTSGWSYAHWQGAFYPPELAGERFLDHYARSFHTVEINTSFYHLPSVQTLKTWYAAVPRDFVFAAKASRYITHMKKLKDPQEGIARYIERMEILADKLGPILFQLPPHWRLNLERLAAFLTALPRGHPYAMEFRDPSWFDPQVYELLAKHKVAFCIYDLDFKLSPMQVTTDLVYVRLHGPDGPYCGQYDERTLAAWALTIRNWRSQHKEVYCYFDNDEAGYAAQDALRLQALVGRDKISRLGC